MTNDEYNEIDQIINQSPFGFAGLQDAIAFIQYMSDKGITIEFLKYYQDEHVRRAQAYIEKRFQANPCPECGHGLAVREVRTNQKYASYSQHTYCPACAYEEYS